MSINRPLEDEALVLANGGSLSILVVPSQPIRVLVPSGGESFSDLTWPSSTTSPQ
jgi:hypothetical protein